MTSSPEVTAFLNGMQPLLAIHQSYRKNGFSTMFRHLRACTPNVTTGAVISMATVSPTSVERRMTEAGHADLRLADPQLWKHELSGWAGVNAGKPKAASKHSWWKHAHGHDAPSNPTWAAMVMQGQRDAGANALLSATGWVDASAVPQGLDDAMRWVQVSRSQVPAGTPMFVNLALDHTWLLQPRLRTLLLTAIVESSEDLWYLRFCWPKQVKRYGQLTHPQVWEGYRELIAVTAAEDKRLVLANVGLTGWVATALGAAGFSTGTSWTEQAFMEPQQGGGGGDPKPRYFDRNLLHVIERASQRRITGTQGYVACTCPYSNALSGPGTWDFSNAGHHYLLNVAELVDTVASAPDAQVSAREIVDAAIAFESKLTGAATLTGNDRPLHLRVWADALV